MSLACWFFVLLGLLLCLWDAGLCLGLAFWLDVFFLAWCVRLVAIRELRLLEIEKPNYKINIGGVLVQSEDEGLNSDTNPLRRLTIQDDHGWAVEIVQCG